jgi:hypothetical protein
MSQLLDPETVKTNQAGRITDSQRALHRPLSRWETIVIGLFVTAFFGAFIFATVLTLGSLPRPYVTLGDVLLALLGPAILLLFAGGLAFAFFYVLAYDRRLKRELVDGPVARVETRVVFSDGFYRVQLAGKTLQTIDGSKALPLPPGTYRISYLPLNKCILSAERLNADGPGGLYAGVLDALALTNGFTLEDLKLNQQGLLSDRQRAQLNSSKPDHAQDLHEGRVATVECVVERHSTSEPNYEWCTYEIVQANGLRLGFTVSDAAYQALIPEIRYRLYYLPHTKRFASIEPLP